MKNIFAVILLFSGIVHAEETPQNQLLDNGALEQPVTAEKTTESSISESPKTNEQNEPGNSTLENIQTNVEEQAQSVTSEQDATATEEQSESPAPEQTDLTSQYDDAEEPSEFNQSEQTLSDQLEKPYDTFDFMVIGLSPDHERGNHVDHGFGFREIYGWQMSENIRGELQFFQSVIDSNNPGKTDFYQSAVGFDMAYKFYASTNSLSAFVLAGGGIVHDDVQPDTDDGFGLFVNLGVGITSSEMTRNGIRVRAEVRYLYDQFKDGYSDLHYGVGLSIPLGKVTVIEKIKIVEVLVEPEKEILDSDNDGVPDGNDQCPNSLPGSNVNKVGCIEKSQTLSINNIYFKVNTSSLTPDTRHTLDNIARSVSEEPNFKIEIAGHTCNIGNDKYNQRLSKSRAESVRAYLIKKGVDKDRLTAKGYGESSPIDSNETESGRQNNRRIEFRIITDKPEGSEAESSSDSGSEIIDSEKSKQ